jgi:pimeloyl-ACP methyl ester carboxylesterase
MGFNTESSGLGEPPTGVQNAETERNIIFEGMKLAYDTYGNGAEALVFVHGWTCSRALWLQQRPLYETRRAILVDLPGHGESEAPHINYNLDLFARALGAILEEEQVSKSVIVAHSMGGPVATLFLRLYPERVSGIVYVDTFLHLPEHYLPREERKLLSQYLQDDANFTVKVECLFADNTTPAVKELVLGTMLATSKHVRTTATTSDALPHALSYDEVFDIPAVHIAAPSCPPMHKHWLHHVPRLRLLQIDGVSHFLFLEEPARFNKEVESFIKKNNLLQGPCAGLKA